MAEGALLEFSDLPDARASLARAFLARKPRRVAEGRSVPRLEARIAGLMPDRRLIERYRRVCGFAAGPHLPVSFLHVLASPLHMAMLTHARFPISLLGLVHVQNQIEQHRPLREAELLDLQCVTEGHRDTERGQEFELRTYARAGDELVWEECCTFLARKGGGEGGQRKDRPRETTGLERARLTSFAVPADIGRRYAAVSADWNPIHLTALTARAFGFPRAIAHGMWTLARIAAELEADWPPGKSRYSVQFKLPVLLPAWVMLQSRRDDGRLAFELRDDAGQRPHVTGSVEPLF